MSRRPIVSIITPSYNQGEFIEETILSIKGQTYKNFEHIVVDAGSTDNTLEILRKYEGTYNLTWSSEPDDGMYQAINKGLKKAQGEILCYLNTDDLYLPWTLRAVVDSIDKKTDVDLIYGDIIKLDEIKGTIELEFCPKFYSRIDILGGGLYQPAVFWRRKAYEKIGGFDENLIYSGDYEYWMRIAQQGKIKKVNEFIAVDRNHYRRKTVALADLSDTELDRVRKKYGLFPIPRSWLKYFYGYYSFFSRRYYMGLFIKQAWQRSGQTRKYWINFLSSPELQLPNPVHLLFRFVPLVGKKKYPWIINKLPSR